MLFFHLSFTKLPNARGHTCAPPQEWMFSWLQEFCMNIYERPSRPGRGGWNLCFPHPSPRTRIRPSFSRVDTLLFFSASVATTEKLLFPYSIINILEFIVNGYLVALRILLTMVSRNCESKLWIGM